MKLRDVPDPVWYGVIALVAVGGAYWLTKRAAGAAGEVLSTTLNPASTENAAYKGVNALGHATGLIGSQDSLGTAIYGAVDTVKGWFGFSDADAMARASSGASGSWSSNGPYDYGTAGSSGIPWRYDAKPLPDPFNFSLDYIK